MWFKSLVEQSAVFYVSVGTFYSINQLLFLFFLYSILGWILEFAYRSISQIQLVNPGFLKGPWVPLYGFICLFIHITLIFTWDIPLIWRMVIYFTVISSIEFITGEMLLRAFKKRFWDYTDERFNLRGHVCLSFSIGWTILSLVFEETIYLISLGIMTYLSNKQMLLINSFVIFLMQIDFIVSSGLLLRLKHLTMIRSVCRLKLLGFTRVSLYHGFARSADLSIKATQLPHKIYVKYLHRSNNR